jgi:hypothetical protein
LPVADLDVKRSELRLIFPQVVDGGGYATQIALMNPSSGGSLGTLAFYDDNGAPMPGQSVINYTLPPNGAVKYATAGNGNLKVGYAVLTTSSGAPLVGNGIVISMKSGGGVTSLAGVPAAPQTTSSRVFIETSSHPLERNTGIALVNRNNQPATIIADLIAVDGTSKTSTFRVPANGHVARFVNELYSNLPRDLQGVVTLTSDIPIAPLTLRLTTNQRGDSIFSTLPVADLRNLPAGTLYIPQVVDGGGYQTQFILFNTAPFLPSTPLGTVRVEVFDAQGSRVTIR